MENLDQALKDVEKSIQLSEQISAFEELYPYCDSERLYCTLDAFNEEDNRMKDCFLHEIVNALAPIEQTWVGNEKRYEKIYNETFWDKIIPSRRIKISKIKRSNERIRAFNEKIESTYTQYRERAEKEWHEIKNLSLEEFLSFVDNKQKELEGFFDAHPELKSTKKLQEWYGYYTGSGLIDIYWEFKTNSDAYNSIQEVIEEYAKLQSDKRRQEEYWRKREEEWQRKEEEEKRKQEEHEAEIRAERLERESKNYDSTKCFACRFYITCDRKRCNFMQK